MSRITDPPEGYAYGPAYRPSRLIILQAILSVAVGRPRSLARDALPALRGAPTPPLVRGDDHLPDHGPLVIVANHYERPRLWMAWPALLLSTVSLLRLGEDVRWIAIQQWEDFRLGGMPIAATVTRLLFGRAFKVYGILAMPPPSARAAARAVALRGAMRTIRAGRVIGLMPEGTVGPTPELLPVRPGVGAFLLLLSAAGAPIVPVGLFEEGGRLVAQFGEPLRLHPPANLSSSERDTWAGAQVMHAIRDLLPAALHGAYTK